MSTLAASGGGQAISGPLQPDLVGRERELDELRRALSRPPAVILLDGEAGIGKSRLLRELLDTRPGITGAPRVPVAVCPPFRQSLTLGPVVDALRTAAPDVRALRLSALAGVLRPVFPEWGDVLPPTPEPLEDAAAARFRLFRALAELLERLGVDLLAVEDAHWADEVTLEFLLFLIARLPQGPGLLLTFRPEEVPPDSLLLRISARLPAGVTRLRLTLGGLDVAQTVRLVSSMLPGGDPSERFATFLHEHTDGVPLAVEELVRLMYDRADLTLHQGEWIRRPLHDIDVPPTIRDAVLERTGRLGAPAQAVLHAAAVLSDPADEAQLSAVAGLPDEDAGTGLARALQSGLLQENDRHQVAFRHVLARLAVYESIPAPLRRRIHLLAGQALQDLTPPPLARLAHHFREGGDTANWCRHARRAAELAAASGDETTAVRLLFDLVTQADLPPRTVVELVEKLPFPALTGVGRYRQIIDALRAALATGGAEPDLAAQLRFQLGWILVMIDRNEEGRIELERSVPLLGHDPARAAQAMLYLGWARGATWPASRHLRWLHRAMALAESVPAPDRMPLLVDIVPGLLLVGEKAGWTHAARVPDDAATGPGRWAVVRGNVNLGDQALRWGLYDLARHRLDTALRLAEKYQYTRYRFGVLATLLNLDLFTGRWDGLGARAAALAEEAGVQPTSRLEVTLVRALHAAATTGHGQVERHLRGVLDEFTEMGIVENCPHPAAALADLQLAGGRVEQALAVTDGPIAMVSAKGTWNWATELAPVRVAALVAAGRVEEAAGLVATFAAGLRGPVPAALAGLATSRALLSAGRGSHVRAAAEFARAAAAWERLPRPYDALLARERQGRCLLAAGRDEAGLALLSDVFSGLSELGARVGAVRVMHTLQAHGIAARRPWWGGRQGYGDQLSPRELDVARLVVAGRTNREIAGELFLSPKTVARHLNSAMRKLEVSSRTALAVRVLESDLVPGEPADGAAT